MTRDDARGAEQRREEPERSPRGGREDPRGAGEEAERSPRGAREEPERSRAAPVPGCCSCSKSPPPEVIDSSLPRLGVGHGPLSGLTVPRKLIGCVEQAICAMGRRFFRTGKSGPSPLDSWGPLSTRELAVE